MCIRDSTPVITDSSQHTPVITDPLPESLSPGQQVFLSSIQHTPAIKDSLPESLSLGQQVYLSPSQHTPVIKDSLPESLSLGQQVYLFSSQHTPVITDPIPESLAPSQHSSASSQPQGSPCLPDDTRLSSQSQSYPHLGKHTRPHTASGVRTVQISLTLCPLPVKM